MSKQHLVWDKLDQAGAHWIKLSQCGCELSGLVLIKCKTSSYLARLWFMVTWQWLNLFIVELLYNKGPRGWKNISTRIYQGFVVSKFFSIHFTISGAKNIIRYTKDFINCCQAGDIILSSSNQRSLFSLALLRHS